MLRLNKVYQFTGWVTFYVESWCKSEGRNWWTRRRSKSIQSPDWPRWWPDCGTAALWCSSLQCYNM